MKKKKKILMMCDNEFVMDLEILGTFYFGEGFLYRSSLLVLSIMLAFVQTKLLNI